MEKTPKEAPKTVVEVEMWAFAKGAIRRVTLPDLQVAARDGYEPEALLGPTFQYGQNDFALPDDMEQRLPSVSVGDIIRLPGGRRFVVMGAGFKEVAADFQPPAGDRGGFYAYSL